MKKKPFPKGWNEKRVSKVLEHYENQTDEEAVAEDEAAFKNPSTTFMEIPNKLVPKVRALLARNTE